MLHLLVHEDAEDDLDALYESDPKAAARIDVFLDELSGDQDLLDRLTQHDFGDDRWGEHPFHVCQLTSQMRLGRNFWRLKLWELERCGRRYRLVYAFVPLKKHHHILGIFPRSTYNYEPDDPRTKRIVNAYLELLG